MKLQRKYTDIAQVKTFAGDSASDMTFEGYASVFGVVDSYGDSVANGAFAKSVAEANDSGKWPALLSQHGFSANGHTPVGIITAMEEDDYGLKITGKLAPTGRGKEMYALMKMDPRPAIDSMSIGYYATKWKAGEGQGQPDRILQEVKLVEISLVTFPANEDATVTSVKSIEELQSLRDIERHMRDAYSLSRGEAKSLISGVKNCLRDADAKAAHADDLIAALKRNIDNMRTQ